MDLIFVLIAFLVGIGFFLWIGRQQPKSDNQRKQAEYGIPQPL
jgi:hypothetical protein